jgi:hypothetical protein
LTPFDVALSPSAPTWKSLFLRSTPTWVASSVLKVFQLRQCAKAACQLHLNGGASTAFLLLCFAGSVAESHIKGTLSTEFRGGQGNILFHHGCGRSE